MTYMTALLNIFLEADSSTLALRGGRSDKYLKTGDRGQLIFLRFSCVRAENTAGKHFLASQQHPFHTPGKEFLFFSSSLMWLRHQELSARDLTRCFIAVRQTDIATYFPLMSSKWAMQETELKQGVRLGPQSESVASLARWRKIYTRVHSG